MKMEVVSMDADYIVACGIVWRKTADPMAGQELVEALESNDQELRTLAQSLLAECGEVSMSLLESAVATGVLNPELAGPCMAEILRTGKLTINDWTGNCERTVN
ncbi:MAG TPA: hypothetical protein VGS27_25045 [Candidatus Sulfotelmatobacter sp.]|nr:hypothetical protein [Candidatus Sulfotelmatobacter sp.]